MNYYPNGREAGATKVPFGKSITTVPLNKVKVFVPIKNAMLQCFRYKGGDPQLFVDVEDPRPEYKFMEGKEIHFGIRGNFELEPVFESNVKKNRIDFFVPISQLQNLIDELSKLL